MNVIGVIRVQDEPLECMATRFTEDGGVQLVEDAVQIENLLSVYVNDILTMQLGCSASDLVELVVGRLFTEGIVEAVADIDAISVCEHSLRADVYLADRAADFSRGAPCTVPTCCTQNRVLNDYFGRGRALRSVQPIAWSPEWVFSVLEEFAKDKTSHARTRGVHSAYLATRDKILCVTEDIGRHNAFDKAVGWALMEQVDLSQCMLFTSGRVPTDMVTKAIRAGVPLLVSKAVATDKTVEIAREYNLTLICSAKNGRFDLMCQGVRTPAAMRRVS